MVQLAAAFLVALVSAAVAAAQVPAPSAEVTVAGCLQRASSSLGTGKHFVLTDAGTSPAGADAPREIAPPEPQRTNEPVMHRPGESDARQETGGVTYLLDGGHDLESKLGQRVEVQGTMERSVSAPPTRPSSARPIPQLRVRQARALAPHC